MSCAVQGATSVAAGRSSPTFLRYHGVNAPPMLCPISTGRFLTPSEADSDGAGEAAGPDSPPPFPGQDYIDPPMPLIGYAAVISVEPEPDNDPGPFAIKPLVDMDIEDIAPPTLQSMANNAASAPSGVVTIE